jgi:hypothetical protein
MLMNLQVLKKQEVYQLAEQLSTFQEGTSSVELVM